MTDDEYKQARLDAIYDRAHPKLDITSYRLEDVLDPALDAEMRAYCEKHEYDYDWFKQRFDAGFQIIPPRKPGAFTVELAAKRIVPLNRLSDCFRWGVIYSIDERARLTGQK